MSDLRTAAQQALEALEYAQQDRECPSTTRQAIAALRAALTQQAEPVQDQRCRAEPRSDGDFVCDCKIGECPGRSAALAQQDEPVEPVAWNWMLDGQPYGQAYYGRPPDADIAERAATAGRTVRLLYTAPPPPQRTMVPLTEEEIMHIGMTHQSLRQVVRAVERAHGIKE